MSNPAVVPIPQEDLDGDDRWMSVHRRYVAAAKGKEPDVLFLGDSHIQLLEQTEVYRDIFAPMHCLCFGNRGDTTASLLWRIENGELESLKPKIIVLLIGTNNRNTSPEQTIEGIKTVAEVIREKQPQATLFVLKIPPRGQRPNPKREWVAAVNAGLQQACSNIVNCSVLEIDPGFVASDGTIDHCDMYDYLHMTNEGYRKAFECVYLAIQTVLNPE